MKQVKIGLTGKQRGALDRSAKEAGRTLSQEIRQRLETSISDDERFSAFAKLMGEQVKWLSQMVIASAFEDDQIVDPKPEDWKKLAPTLQRALIVALNEWLVIMFGQLPAADPRADAIGQTAAKNLKLLAAELERRAAEQEDEELENDA